MGNKHTDTTAPERVAIWTEVLQQSVRAAFLRGDGLPLLVRVGVPVVDIDPFMWLASREGPDRMLWQARHHNKIRAMCGVATSLSGDVIPDPRTISSAIESVLSRPGDEMRFFGGMRFDADREPDELWSPFGGYRFVLPRFELHVRGTNAQIYCNLIFPEDSNKQDAILSEIESLGSCTEIDDSPLAVPGSRSDYPNKTGWFKRIRWALDMFLNRHFEKVVLARRADFVFPEAVNAFAILRRLVKATPNCFHFHFESAEGDAFIGASPERLFYRNGLQVDSEAVAGTRPRGETEDVDEEYLASLLASEKDQREHAYVRESIVAALKTCCDSVTVDHEASEMRLARGRHLFSRVSGVISEPVSHFELMQRLHPTPAVGGHPTDYALGFIRDLENFDRGWYAGPVGWVGRDTAEFAVAIRCGLLSGRKLSLFSGAGIVEGSRPDLEWEEIEQKIVDFVKVIGADRETA